MAIILILDENEGELNGVLESSMIVDPKHADLNSG